MTEEIEKNKDMRLAPSDPFRIPTELLGNEVSMRGLFVVHFSCPLCG